MSTLGVLLVSSAKIKAFTNVNDNLDEQLLLPNIQIAQDLGLQNLLGTKFYNTILTNAQNSTLTSAQNTLLQDYIQPYLLWRAVYEALPSIYMRLMNKTVIVGDTEQGKAVSKTDFSYLRDIHQSRFEFYAQRLMDYIKNNPGDYPEYWTWTSTDGMAPSKENYFSGIQFHPGMRKLPNPNFKLYGLRSYSDPTGDNCCNDSTY